MDVQSAYLNGEIKEEVYMAQPENFVSRKYPEKVCRLKKAIHGLKQAGIVWNEKLDTELKYLGLKQIQSDNCVYIKHHEGILLVAIYVDDLIIAVEREDTLISFRESMKKIFKMKDLGKINYCLGIRIQTEKDGSISTDQEKYIEELLAKYRMKEAKPISTPMDSNSKLTKISSIEVSTRPDIAYAVSALGQFSNDPRRQHWNEAKRVLRYLKGTLCLKITYKKTNETLYGYVDADWGGNLADRKSQTGLVFFLAGGPIAWESKKQQNAALSSTESELEVSERYDFRRGHALSCVAFHHDCTVELTSRLPRQKSRQDSGRQGTSKQIDHCLYRKMEQGREEDSKEPMKSDPDYESGENTTIPKKETTLGRTQEVPPSHEDATPPPPVSDVLGRLTKTLHQLSAVTGHRERWNRYDGSYEAQSFFTHYDAQADRYQLQYSTRLRKPPDLLQAPLRVTNTRAYSCIKIMYLYQLPYTNSPRASNTCPMDSPITLVTKRDKSKRFCVDYRRINEIIAPDVHPLPLIENILDKLSRAKYFSSADISSAYWQVEIDPSSRHLLAFVTLDGQYEFCRLPFGMRNSPQIFERAINQIFQKYKLNFIAHYFDYFIIFSDTLEEHIQHVEKFLEICQQENIKLNYKKCEFLKTSIEFLGYTVKNGTYTPQTRNLDIINAIKPPFNQKTLQSFLGAVNVYNKFIPDYARLRTPLNHLLKKDTKWQWDEKCQQAFTALKESLTSKPVLHLYQDGLPCRLYCDASTQGIAGILKQVHPDGKVHPTQYYSRALRPHERNYTISELECLAIVESIYLSGTKFTVYSDHQALQWLKTIKNPSGRLFRWSLRLSTYDYEIQYLKGTQQHEADLLSRNPFCGFISARTIKKHQPNITDTSVAVDVNGLHTIRRKGVNRIIIPEALQHSLMNQVHSEYNHPGISQMARLISTQYYWKDPKIRLGIPIEIYKYLNVHPNPKKKYYNKGLQNVYFRIERPHSPPKNSANFCYLARSEMPPKKRKPIGKILPEVSKKRNVRSAETAVQREHRLRINRERASTSRAAESVGQRENRLQQDRDRASTSRAAESVGQRENRLRQNRNRGKNFGLTKLA
ncbi:hypothetical protein LAZ67_3001326 [Cordylochernes scorpioides]|uniref:Reverse transcriptase domain-containing protein n=1 Tax=Cordylochernes scorpioides TaxID=51811 RepID=A0ABY6K6W5_9ARAC|nr:hypothetical protein LAZ67_3001326 [Cordylochernes scorpioides]